MGEGLAYISRQVQADAAGRLAECPLKTESSRRAVALDTVTVASLQAHRRAQGQYFEASGIRPGGWGVRGL